VFAKMGVLLFLQGMLSVIQAIRVVTGSTLILAGLIAIPLPLTPGIPLIILGASIGFTWHPKGLRIWRRCRVKAGRCVQRVLRRKRIEDGVRSTE